MSWHKHLTCAAVLPTAPVHIEEKLYMEPYRRQKGSVTTVFGRLQAATTEQHQMLPTRQPQLQEVLKLDFKNVITHENIVAFHQRFTSDIP